ncbi:MAG: hypothetical protein ABI460_02790 [Caldimonas sp.]
MLRSEGFLWLLFGALWIGAILSGIEDVRRGEDRVLRTLGRGSYEHYWFFLLAYLIGGAVVAMLHSRMTDKLPGASFTRTETAEGVRFDTVPAPKFFAMWPTGAIGIIFVLTLPSAVYGNGFCLLFCIGFGGLLLLMAYVPKLWLRGKPRTFTVAPTRVLAGLRSLAVDAQSAFTVGNSLRYKPYNVPPQTRSGMSDDLRHNVYYAPGGNPLGAQALAGAHDAGVDMKNAVANGLAEMAYRYYVDMRARSWRIKFRSGGRDHVIADGLDGGTAEALLREAGALVAVREAA